MSLEKKPEKKVLITDLDNTLFDWFEVWHTSFSAMLNNVLAITRLDRKILLDDIKKIHQKYGTSEYAFLLEEVDCLINFYGTKEEVRKELAPSIEAFRDARSRSLRLYDGVAETLEELMSKGVLIIAYTESKSFYSAFRIQHLKLDKYIDILYSPPDHEIPSNKKKYGEYKLEKTNHKYTPEGEIKPNPELLLDIIKDVGVLKEHCVYIGDSKMKDIDMAQRAGITDVYAQYGTKHIGDIRYELLKDVTHWPDEDVARENEIKKSDTHITPSHVVESFSEILNLFDFKKN